MLTVLMTAKEKHELLNRISILDTPPEKLLIVKTWFNIPKRRTGRVFVVV